VSTSLKRPWRSRGAERLLFAVALPTFAAALAPHVVAVPAMAQQQTARQKKDQAAARARGEEGLKLFEEKRWPEAYEAFREADELYHANTLVLFMGHCRREMGKLLEARALYFKVAEEEVPKNAPEQFKKAQAKARDEIKALQARIPLLRVSISGIASRKATATLDGAAVSVDDLQAGKEVDPGDHTIVIEAPGSAAVERGVAVNEGDVTRVEIVLAPPKATEAKKKGSILPGAIALGVGAVGVGIGAATGIIAMGQIDDIKSRCTPDGHCPEADKPKADAAQSLVTVSTVGFVVGGAALAAGAVLIVLRPWGGDSKAAEPKAASAHVTVGLGSIGLGGSF
jgi:hypothetical protein